jgi:voltage-gated potassium channel
MLLSAQSREEALQKFERSTSWPMLILALAIIPIIVAPMVADLSPSTISALNAADWLIWAAFAVEYLVRLTIVPKKMYFVIHHPLDLIVVAVPFAQPLRIIRSVRVLRVFRAGRAATYLGRGAEEGRSLFSRENFSFAFAVSSIALFGGAAIVYGLERNAANSNIKTLPDAVWWAISTVSTVGYGDRYPVTPEGRAIAVVLMLLGIGLFGLLAATMASFFVEQQHKGEFAQLSEKIERLEAMLTDRQELHPADDTLPPASSGNRASPATDET